ncbi:MAG: sel1 repeat family protein [Alphaproteobacteria bacterium]|nr:sel1 repeat family protein [Alphaproteobacteria bacterium]
MAAQRMIGARLAMVIALALAPVTTMAQGFGTSPTSPTPNTKPQTPPAAKPPQDAAKPDADKGKPDADKGKPQLVMDLQPAFDAIKAKDWTGAEKFLLTKARSNDPRAQFLLGAEVYGNKESKLYDPKKSIPLIKDSAERGFARSMLFYGIAYADGAWAGLPKDMVEAYKWTALASRRGVPEAGQFLASMAKDMTPDQIDRAKAAADKYAPRR